MHTVNVDQYWLQGDAGCPLRGWYGLNVQRKGRGDTWRVGPRIHAHFTPANAGVLHVALIPWKMCMWCQRAAQQRGWPPCKGLAFSPYVGEVHYLSWTSRSLGLAVEKERGKRRTVSVGLNAGRPVKVAEPTSDRGSTAFSCCSPTTLTKPAPSLDTLICWRMSKLVNCEAVRSKGVWFGLVSAASSATRQTSEGNPVATIITLGPGQQFKVLPWSLSVPDRPQYRRLRSGLWACRSITAAINRVLLTGREKETGLVLKKVLLLNSVVQIRHRGTGFLQSNSSQILLLLRRLSSSRGVGVKRWCLNVEQIAIQLNSFTSSAWINRSRRNTVPMPKNLWQHWKPTQNEARKDLEKHRCKPWNSQHAYFSIFECWQSFKSWRLF